MTDLTGMKFGRWLVLSKCGDKSGAWHCRCECGVERDVRGSALIRGMSKSCGCYCVDKAMENHTTHRGCGTRLYHVWRGMLQRCYYPKHIDRKWYAGNGITVCEEWQSDYVAFRDWALGNGYRPGLSIDRIDNSRGYSPDNCRWATPKEQACNRSTNLNYTHNGKTQCLKQWAEELNIKYHTLYCRIKNGHEFEDAIAM